MVRSLIVDAEVGHSAVKDHRCLTPGSRHRCGNGARPRIDDAAPESLPTQRRTIALGICPTYVKLIETLDAVFSRGDRIAPCIVVEGRRLPGGLTIGVEIGRLDIVAGCPIVGFADLQRIAWVVLVAADISGFRRCGIDAVNVDLAACRPIPARGVPDNRSFSHTWHIACHGGESTDQLVFGTSRAEKKSPYWGTTRSLSQTLRSARTVT